MATALPPLAFFAVVMAKAFRTPVDDRTEVSVETGLRAAEKLQSVLDGRERGTDTLKLKVQLGKIGEAVRAVVPQEMWAAIVEKLEELEQHSGALDVVEDSFDDADDDPYDPTEFIDERRRVLTSAAPTVTERDRDRCRCGRGVRGDMDLDRLIAAQCVSVMTVVKRRVQNSGLGQQISSWMLSGSRNVMTSA